MSDTGALPFSEEKRRGRSMGEWDWEERREGGYDQIVT